ncbi:hypothetical protein ccbrp13_03420 [Ktedonobacteria bacterium brp13]|nr:hypothetical protein ccbrp13_03420 [Ktedonobacteria bacterium brp13]
MRTFMYCISIVIVLSITVVTGVFGFLLLMLYQHSDIFAFNSSLIVILTVLLYLGFKTRLVRRRHPFADDKPGGVEQGRSTLQDREDPQSVSLFFTALWVLLGLLAMLLLAFYRVESTVATLIDGVLVALVFNLFWISALWTVVALVAHKDSSIDK